MMSFGQRSMKVVGEELVQHARSKSAAKRSQLFEGTIGILGDYNP